MCVINNSFCVSHMYGGVNKALNLANLRECVDTCSTVDVC